MSKSKYNKRLKEKIKKEKDEMGKRLRAKRICMWMVLFFEAFLIIVSLVDVAKAQKSECTGKASSGSFSKSRSAK